MAHMDVFESDAFSQVNMTRAVEKTPFVPNFLRTLNIFEPEPIDTEKVSIEKRENQLAMIQTTPRGAPLETRSDELRDIRDFRTVRIGKSEVIQASEILGIRAFGSETERESVQRRIARANMRLRADMEATHENMRLGAIQGIVLDADGTVINNWFTEWNITQAVEFDFELDTATTNVRGKCMDVIRAMSVAGQGAMTPITQVHALCGDSFFDTLINHDRVRDTFLSFQDARDLRGNLAFQSFNFGGIMFHNYRGSDVFVDANSSGLAGLGIDDTEAKFFPVNAPGVFQVALSPGESFDLVNQPGQEVFGLLVRDLQRNEWVEVEQKSYPLYICTRPEMLQSARQQ